MQFAPLPRMKPRQPSSFHIFLSPCPIGSLYSVLPALCIWKRIFSRSKGDTTVLETAPATPPARNAASTGCAMVCRSCMRRDSGAGIGSPSTSAMVEGPCRSTLILSSSLVALFCEFFFCVFSPPCDLRLKVTQTVQDVPRCRSVGGKGR